MIVNKPEYILTDEMQAIVAATKDALNADPDVTTSFPDLNYQYGYIEELNETLIQMENNPDAFLKKFPLIWLAEPFVTKRGNPDLFGIATVDVFIINTTTKTWKAKERMTENYIPILLPIYRELLIQTVKSVAISIQTVGHISHTVTKGYYWGEAQKAVLNDAVDCLKLGQMILPINNKEYCKPFKSF